MNASNNINLYFSRIATVRVGKAGQTGFISKGLRTTFDITKSTKAESNKCQLSIYNLSKDYSSKITVNDGMIAELMVGYTNDVALELVFVGDIIEVSQDEHNPDKVITIDVEDGGAKIRKALLSISLDDNATLRDIFQMAISQSSIKYQSKLFEKIPDIKLKNGIAFAGYLSDLLNTIAKAYNLEWSIQNGLLQVNQYTNYITSNPVTIQNLQAPKRIYLNKSKEVDDKNFNGYEIRCLLQPKIIPGGTITIDKKKFKVMNVSHSGDTHGDSWESIITVKDV